MNSKKLFLLLLFVNTAIFCLACWALPVLFEDNDDASMAWIASGIYSGMPDCHLEFINAIYGKLLNVLYLAISGIEWYSVLFGLFHILSVTIISWYVVCLFKGNKILFCLTLLFVNSLWLWIVARFQFTTTAAVLAFASVLLLLDRKFILGGCLLMVSGLIRFSAAGLVGLIMVPAFFYYYGNNLRSWMKLAIVLFIAVSLHLCDGLFYQSTDWKSYRVFDSYRGKINDNPNLWRLKGNLPEGVDSINYGMVQSFFADPKAMSVEQLDKVVDYLYHGIPLRKRVKNVMHGCLKGYWFWFLFVAMLLLPVLLVKGDKRIVYMILAGYVLWIFSLSFISINHTVKNRVFTSSFIAASFYPIILYSIVIKRDRRKLGLVLCSLMCVFGICKYAIPAITRHNALKPKYETIAQQMEIAAEHPDYSIVSNGADYAVEMIPPFDLSKSISARSFINPYCYMGSPLNNDRLPSHLALLRDDVAMMSVLGNDDCKELLEAIYHNYGVKADTIHIAELGCNILLKFVLSEE